MRARDKRKKETAPTGGQVPPYIFCIKVDSPQTGANTDSEQTTTLRAHRGQKAKLKAFKRLEPSAGTSGDWIDFESSGS